MLDAPPIDIHIKEARLSIFDLKADSFKGKKKKTRDTVTPKNTTFGWPISSNVNIFRASCCNVPWTNLY